MCYKILESTFIFTAVFESSERHLQNPEWGGATATKTTLAFPIASFETGRGYIYLLPHFARPRVWVIQHWTGPEFVGTLTLLSPPRLRRSHSRWIKSLRSLLCTSSGPRI